MPYTLQTFDIPRTRNKKQKEEECGSCILSISRLRNHSLGPTRELHSRPGRVGADPQVRRSQSSRDDPRGSSSRCARVRPLRGQCSQRAVPEWAPTVDGSGAVEWHPSHVPAFRRAHDLPGRRPSHATDRTATPVASRRTHAPGGRRSTRSQVYQRHTPVRQSGRDPVLAGICGDAGRFRAGGGGRGSRVRARRQRPSSRLHAGICT